ncbi:MAG TPA: hypothetical protein VGH26_11320 [Gaiellaceae bacterium]
MSMVAPSKRTRLVKEQRALLLGASDMRQAAAAARALEHEQDVDLARALETAMMVCFMRPFTRSDLQVPEKFFPLGEDGEHLENIKAHRDKVYAHTDTEAGRWAESVSYTFEGDGITMQFREGWNAINRAAVPDFVALCKRVEDEFTLEAGAIQLVLDGHEPSDIS